MLERSIRRLFLCSSCFERRLLGDLLNFMYEIDPRQIGVNVTHCSSLKMILLLNHFEENFISSCFTNYLYDLWEHWGYFSTSFIDDVLTKL